ncbi:hypothetical protein [Dyadobacter frigoris]|nr:hypothetical protein [Dyadobacter frigoris]
MKYQINFFFSLRLLRLLQSHLLLAAKPELHGWLLISVTTDLPRL